MKKLLFIILTLTILCSCDRLPISHTFNDLPEGIIMNIRNCGTTDPNDSNYNLRRVTIKSATGVQDFNVSFSYLYGVQIRDTIKNSINGYAPPVYNEEDMTTRPEEIELTISRNKPVKK